MAHFSGDFFYLAHSLYSDGVSVMLSVENAVSGESQNKV